MQYYSATRYDGNDDNDATSTSTDDYNNDNSTVNYNNSTVNDNDERFDDDERCNDIDILNQSILISDCDCIVNYESNNCEYEFDDDHSDENNDDDFDIVNRVISHSDSIRYDASVFNDAIDINNIDNSTD